MKTISFCVAKGGTGKTTLSGNIGREIANHGKTLLIDGDPQGNLTTWLLTEPPQHELSEYLDGVVSFEVVPVPVSQKLDIMPSFSVGGGLRNWADTQAARKPFAFTELLETAGRQYEYAIIDLGPGLTTFEQTALSAVDEVIGVLLPEMFSFDGLETLEAVLEDIKQSRRAQFTMDKLVVNRLNRSYSTHKLYADMYEKTRYKIYPVGQSTRLADCPIQHQTIWEYAPGDKSTEEIGAIAWDIMEAEIHEKTK